jgi:superfamily II DNA or RNA helicase
MHPNKSDLFIVDNSISGWTGLRYLAEWTEISKTFDIATGYFEIGALLELDGKWQKLDHIRILMGSDTTMRTRKELLEALSIRAKEMLDRSIEEVKTPNPFLEGVAAIAEAMRSGKIECRVYSKDKFHAKAYITHGRLEVVGSRALVGSSNFTAPGLNQNVELNVQIQTGADVALLQEWYEAHWDEAEEITDLVSSVIERQIKEYSPFEVYAKSLFEYFRGHSLTGNEWDETQSKMFPILDQYQREAYWALIDIARQHSGAFLCDGVGLGKTFVGLMLIERLVMHESKRVVLFAPKAARESVWDPHIKQWLDHLGGKDFSNLSVFSHTDLTRKGEFPERFRRIAELADVVIIDEAHHFRNRGKMGTSAENVDDEQSEPSRYYKLFDLLDGSIRPKTLFMLTATPINNRLTDFRNLCELFTRRQEGYFAGTLGINHLTAHFTQLEKKLRQRLGNDDASVTENLDEASEVLGSDIIFQKLVVQRSRSYARESQIREKGAAASFPDRKPPQVADYSIRKSYGRLLDLVETAFTRTDPLFTLALYYPLHWYKGADGDIDSFEENRQKQVVGLIRTNFLKRFESSVWSFEQSCSRLLLKLLAFIEVNVSGDADRKRLSEWKDAHAPILGLSRQRELAFYEEQQQTEEEEDDVVPPELLAKVTKLDPKEYRVGEMLAETYRDLTQIVKFIEECRKFQPSHDDKLRKLIRLLKSKELAGEKILVFTEFADTGRYLVRQLRDAGIEGVEGVDSGTKGSRADIIQRFAPYYNGSSSPELERKGKKEIGVLISTDVLSEGLNLQDASRMMNYDIHWNPVRLMQRIGRVDRRMNPMVEVQLVKDHPHLKPSRGKVSFWNFLPPDELNSLLTLYTKVTHKTLMISETLGIEHGKLLRPDDDFRVLEEFNANYDGKRTALENMHLELQDLLREDENLAAKLQSLPGSLFSGREKPNKGIRGVFFCYALPALDKETGAYTEQAGTTRWYLLDLERNEVIEDVGSIADFIRSAPDIPRHCVMTAKALTDCRKILQDHIHKTHLKRINAPMGVKPALKAWMEIN